MSQATPVLSGLGREFLKSIPLLESVTRAYLLLPLLIFAAGWLHPGVGWPLALLGALTMLDLARSTAWQRPSGRSFAGILLGAFVIAALSGIGGVGLQNWDHNKHNAILHDLIVRDWPVRYSQEGDPGLVGPLVYYTAWYLPAALVGKIAGWGVACAALFLWGWLGLSLVFAWIHRLVGSKWAIPLVLFFSGWDVVAIVASGRNPLQLSNLQMHHWAGFAQYTHNLAAIDWVPHHAIPIWLGAAFLLNLIRTERREGGAALWATLPLWSPWAWVGLAPFLGLAWWRGKGAGFDRRTVAPALLGLVSLLYLASNRGQVIKGFAWTFVAPADFPVRYLGFVALEFGILAAALLWARKVRKEDQTVLRLTLALLLLLPLYRFGISGDLTMRASMPALLVLAILFAQAVTQSTGRTRSLLLVLWAVGALSPLHELTYSVIHYRLGPPPASDLRPLPFTDGRQYARQFLGDPDKGFWRTLAK